jgi:uncharacterized membrane protein
VILALGADTASIHNSAIRQVLSETQEFVPSRVLLTLLQRDRIFGRDKAGMNVNRAVLYLGCFSIGIIAGLRSLTAPALVSWAAHLGWLDLSGSWLSFLGLRAAIIILSFLALCELVADKLPKTPNRTDLGPLVFRAITGGLSSMAICASAHQSPVIGTILGVLGSLASAFAGYEIRHRLVEAFGLPDFGVAVAEDIVAIGGGLLIVSQLF